MFRVLLGKMTEFDISFKMLSENVDMSEKVLKQCIKTGEREIRLSEAVRIRDYVAPDMTIDELFKPVTRKKTDTEEDES